MLAFSHLSTFSLHKSLSGDRNIADHRQVDEWMECAETITWWIPAILNENCWCQQESWNVWGMQIVQDDVITLNVLREIFQ